MDILSYVLSKKYTDQSLAGGGAVAGKNCVIEQITEITGGHRVHFKWTLDDGTTKRDTLDVMDGPQGIQGIKGDTGNTGAAGAKGDAGTITIGTVASGESPSVTNVGTASDAVLNFTLPKGDKGDKGDRGADGQNGSSFSIRARFSTEEELLAAYPDGPENPGDAYFVGTTASPSLYIWLIDDQEWHDNGPIAGVKGDKGDTGDDGFSPVASVSKSNGVATISIRDKVGQTTATVSDGTDGSDGKSAYEVAVDEGFVGTEAEWLASLVGAKGDDGQNGTNGTDGVSPVANVTKTGDSIKIHIQDALGTTEQTIDMSTYAKASDVTAIEGKIPSGASSSNKLATASDITGITEKIPSGASSSNKLATASDITGITEKIPSNASSSNKLVTKSDAVTKYNYSMAGTASLEDDIKTFVTALIALGANTYVGFFNRSGSLGTAGNYSITVYAEEGTSSFASGYIALGAGATGKTQYIVSYYKPTGSSGEWTIKKLVTDEIVPSDASASNKLVATNAIYKTLNRSWNEVGNRFIKLSNAYPVIGLRTNNYVVSCRNGETYLLLCGTTDGGYTVAPEVYLLYDGTGKLTTNGFYYDSTTKEIAFMTQGYNNVSVTQISGEVNDIILSEISETNPLSNPVAITPQKLVTESDFNYKSGTVNFSCGANLWTTVDVDFDSPMPDTDYVVTLESGNTAYVHVQNVTHKATNGFVIIVWNRDDLSNGRGIINWQAYKIPH